jgi:hypothetical protein
LSCVALITKIFLSDLWHRSSNCSEWFTLWTWPLKMSWCKTSWSVMDSNSPDLKCRLLEAKNVCRGCLVQFFTRCCTLLHFTGNSCQCGVSWRPEKTQYTP